MLEGTWRAVGGRLGTESIPIPATCFVITGDTYVIETPAGIERGCWVWLETEEPRVLRLTGTTGQHANQVIEALVRVRGSVMQLCYAVDGGPRPQDFADAETRGAVVTMRYHRDD